MGMAHSIRHLNIVHMGMETCSKRWKLKRSILTGVGLESNFEN